MDTSIVTTDPIWTDTTTIPRRQRLDNDVHCDVCVVGAGIAGLTTAYLLACEGRDVVVLDRAGIGGGETACTTAHVVNALDDRYADLERLHGEDGARLAAESHTKAIDRIESIVDDEGIDCAFERLDGYLFTPPGDDVELLDEELAAAHRAGLHDVHLVRRVPWQSFDTGPALRFPGQAQFHPMRYLAGLARAVEARGGRIHTDTSADDMHGGPGAVVTTTGGRTVTTRAIVVATNTPVNNIVTIHTKQAAYRTYVIGLSVPRGSVVRALYWDTPHPYHYVRLADGDGADDVLIVGGEDHKTGQEDEAHAPFAALEAWTRERFPMAGDVRHAWSGQVLEPVDSLAFIGRNPGDADNVYVVTGDSGNGMTHGTIAGILLADLIAGRENAWSTLYDPARVTLRATPRFAKENLNVAAQYAALATPGDIGSPADLAPGTGAILRRGLKKVAVYRDDSSAVHELSAVCPHLGCIVQWNDAEKSWDCPCHGSRFNAEGSVINGPAIQGLERLE